MGLTTHRYIRFHWVHGVGWRLDASNTRGDIFQLQLYPPPDWGWVTNAEREAYHDTIPHISSLSFTGCLIIFYLFFSFFFQIFLLVTRCTNSQLALAGTAGFFFPRVLDFGLSLQLIPLLKLPLLDELAWRQSSGFQRSRASFGSIVHTPLKQDETKFFIPFNF